MTEKIVGAQYRVVAPDYDNIWEKGTVIELTWDDGTDCPEFTDTEGTRAFADMTEVELITEDTDEPDHSQTVAQSLNTLIQQYGMATVTSGIEQWLKFHSKEQK